jgi:hypothetical protein
LRLISLYRLRIEEIKGAEVVTSYTRWFECVQAKGAENPEVYLTFSPSFERIWLEAKKRLPAYVSQKTRFSPLRMKILTIKYNATPDIIQYGRISPPDPQVFAGLYRNAARSREVKASHHSLFMLWR